MLAAGIVFAIGMAGCDYGPETRDPPQVPGQGVQPDPQLGERPGDVDIGARSTSEDVAERNETAAQADAGSDATGQLDSAGADAPESTQVAALGAGGGAVSASAVLEPTEGNDARGDASFIDTEEGLQIVVTMTGLEPGPHGIHVHENADCSGPAAQGAGDHFNPEGAEHGAPSDELAQRHAGDLGNITAESTGQAELNMTVDGLTVQGEHGVAHHAIIVHAGEDDLMSQPSGQSGDPVACGVIEVSARG